MSAYMKMDSPITLREFEKKYGIPYHIVREASYRIDVDNYGIWNRPFPEMTLASQVYTLLEKRIQRQQKTLEEYNDYIGKLKEVYVHERTAGSKSSSQTD